MQKSSRERLRFAGTSFAILPHKFAACLTQQRPQDLHFQMSPICRFINAKTNATAPSVDLKLHLYPWNFIKTLQAAHKLRLHSRLTIRRIQSQVMKYHVIQSAHFAC